MVSADKILMFSGKDEDWETYRQLVNSVVGVLVFVLQFAQLNNAETREEGLDNYFEWCQETDEEEYELCEKTCFDELKKEESSISRSDAADRNPTYQYAGD
eukprot:543993-Rhodomonas_salina.1